AMPAADSPAATARPAAPSLRREPTSQPITSNLRPQVMPVAAAGTAAPDPNTAGGLRTLREKLLQRGR
ncbi:MAG TPA: hypothetical protein PK970_13825, partial [Hyphomicrobiaceae bacterium]|nr:hypothetical protein [Hyphomicrobiaceae bacterium]